jgi:chromosome partitioning protein
VDLDVLARVDPETFEVQAASHYADLVGEARRQRRLVDSRDMDWVVVRNRLSALRTRNRKKIDQSLKQLSGQIGFRLAKGISERVVYRELFPRGLTALDTLDRRTLGGEPTLSHVSARDEIRNLLQILGLPARAAAGASGAPGGTAGTGGNRQEPPRLRRAG